MTKKNDNLFIVEARVSPETEKKLECVGYRKSWFEVKPPTLSLAQRFLREYTDGHVNVIPNQPTGSYLYKVDARIEASENTGFYFKEVAIGGFLENYTYEEALAIGIDRALDIMLKGKGI